ncbi:unnamed protein product [Effrenium voratum]|nr:unnamed protein product [Effrenium voratum]
MEGDDEPDPENSGEDATGTRSDGSAVPSEMLMVSSSRLLELPAASVASVASKKGDVLHHLEQYYKSNFTSSASLTLEDTRRPGLTCVLPKNFVLPRSIVKRSLQFLDQEGSPDCPGEMKLGEMLKAMHRFHNKFGQDTTIDWDLQFLEDMGINTNSQTFDPDWMVQWNRPTLFSRFAVRLGTMERIYFVLDLGDNSSVISRCVSGFLFTAVLVSLLLWIGGTMESIRVVPCAGTEINTCVPLEPRWMKTAELVCVWIFTLEILLRLICAPQARRELLNHRFLIAVITDHQSQVQQPPSTHLGRFRKFIFSIEAICDILSVVPFWAEAVLETADKQVEQLSVLRALKVTRVVRVYKLTRALNADLGQFNEINDLFRKVMGNASPAILMTFLLIIIALFFFGTFIWFCERGEWVDASNPRYQALFAVGMGTDKGAWLRVSSDGLTEELSPFDSIPGVFWWTVVTITTVGYGDQVPTTPLGKIVGSVAMLYGTVILGLPLFVVGATFGQEYDRLMKDAKRRLGP